MEKQIKMYSVKLGMVKTEEEKRLSSNKFYCGKRIGKAKDNLSVKVKEEVGTDKWTKECVARYKIEKENDTWLNIWKSAKDTYSKLLNEEIVKNETKVRELNIKAFNKFNVIAVFSNNLTRMLGLDDIKEPIKDIIILECEDADRNLLKQVIYNGLMVDGDRYRFFTASAGQTRLQKIQVIKESLWIKYEKSLMCGLTIDDINNSKEHGCNINKYLAYLSLNGSATDEWERFDIDRTIVVEDFETIVNGEVDYIDKNKFKINMKNIRSRIKELSVGIHHCTYRVVDKKITKKVKIKYITRKHMDIPISHSDGCGMMLPSVSKKNFMVRLPWVKGLLTPVDWIKWIKEYRQVKDEKQRYKITDIYGKEYDLVKDDIHIIFSKSQFKMWKYYTSWEQYKNFFKEFNCKANTCNVEDDEFRDAKLNYQMWQTLTDITDEEIKFFTEDSIEYIKKAHYDKEFMMDILGATGNYKFKSNLQKAIMKYPEMLQDKSIKEVLDDAIEKKRKEVRIGRINGIEAKYTFILPDVFAWCDFLFNGNVTPIGLLEADEVYCKLFKEADKLVVNRSPHLFREHGCRMNADSEDKLIKKWFITNGCYTSSYDLISKLLQFDVDGDKALVIKSPKFYDIAQRNMKGIVPLYYEMGKAKAVKINMENIYTSLISAYSSGNVGKFSNCLTNIWNSGKAEEYISEMKIICALNNWSIDSAKTLEMPEAPVNINKILEKGFKKVPYFFKYAKSKKNTQVYKISNSTVNKFCAEIDNMGNVKYNFGNEFGKFNHKVFLSNDKMIVKDIDQRIVDTYMELSKLKYDKSDKLGRDGFYEVLSYEFEEVCNECGYNIIAATDMMIKYCYIKNKDSNKTLLWNMLGDIILDNMDKNIKKKLDEGYVMCECCGARVKDTNGKTKYCNICAKEVKKEQDRKAQKRTKNKIA